MSHHYSGPDFSFPQGDARLDFTDLYAFPKPGDAGKSILIMNVHPAAGENPPGPTATELFAPDAIYELKIDTNGDAVAEIAYAPAEAKRVAGTLLPDVMSYDSTRPAAFPNNGRTLTDDAFDLHGLPSSSRMFEPLFSRISDRYHLVARDYPGFGHSDWPDPKTFAYTFDHIAGTMNHFTEALGLSRYTLYMQDYGGPVGFRMALTHPDRIEALIVQDAVSHNEGLGANWKPRRAFWADRGANESTLRTNLLSLATTRTRHVGNDPNVERYDPDLWTDEFAFISQPAQVDIQSDLFYDYRTNVDSYPKWQAWMRERQPRLLVIWGKYELSFDSSEPEPYRRDVPNAEIHIVDGGHFALDTAADEIAAIVGQFIKVRK